MRNILHSAYLLWCILILLPDYCFWPEIVAKEGLFVAVFRSGNSVFSYLDVSRDHEPVRNVYIKHKCFLGAGDYCSY